MYLRGFGYLWSFLLSFTKITIISLRKVKTKQHLCVIFVKIQDFLKNQKNVLCYWTQRDIIKIFLNM